MNSCRLNIAWASVLPDGSLLQHVRRRHAVQLGELRDGHCRSGLVRRRSAAGRGRPGTSRRSASPTEASGRATSRSAQTSACCEHERIVEQRQRLGGHVGHVAAALRHLAAGDVERAEKLGRLHQVVLDVDAAPAVAVERAGEQPPVGVFLLADTAGCSGRTACRVEPAGRGQDRIANRLRLHPPGRIVLTAAGSADRARCAAGDGSAGQLERPRQHQRADQPLDRPAVRDELARPGNRAARDATAARRRGRSRRPCGPGPCRTDDARRD